MFFLDRPRACPQTRRLRELLQPGTGSSFVGQSVAGGRQRRASLSMREYERLFVAAILLWTISDPNSRVIQEFATDWLIGGVRAASLTR